MSKRSIAMAEIHETGLFILSSFGDDSFFPLSSTPRTQNLESALP
jgi:hypothetical protein